MTGDEIEDILLLLESTANMLRGMTMDPVIPAHAKDAMRHRIAQLELAVKKHSEG